jgi:mannose-6-phosphate isomerase-like protein (cupin superfamily)
VHPKRKGAALTELNSVSHATLAPHASTVPAALQGEQQIFFVVSGEGTIRAGSKTAQLRPGIGILLPPGLEFGMSNTGNEFLEMYLVVEPVPPGFTPRKDMGVSDEYTKNISMSVHWSNMDRDLFTRAEGLSTLEGIGPIMIDAMNMAQPHSHEPGVEEVWFAIEGDIWSLLGKQIRNLPVGTAYRVPSDGMTAHANINLSDRPIKIMWMMKVVEK